jgi:tRNA(fMet)-specific endonuclease VapC
LSTQIYLLDTNTVAYIVSGRSSAVRLRLAEVAKSATISISTITEAEIRYGIAKKPQATRLRTAVEEFLGKVTILPWDSDSAATYGLLRATLSARGKTLSALDLLIAAQAVAIQATLVTSDLAFAHIGLPVPVIDWANGLDDQLRSEPKP